MPGKKTRMKISFDDSVISKWMIVIAFASPLVLSASFMAIAFFATQNTSSEIRTISLTVGTFLGIGLSIVIIFLIQKIINKKLEKRKETADIDENNKKIVI